MMIGIPGAAGVSGMSSFHTADIREGKVGEDQVDVIVREMLQRFRHRADSLELMLVRQ